MESIFQIWLDYIQAYYFNEGPIAIKIRQCTHICNICAHEFDLVKKLRSKNSEREKTSSGQFLPSAENNYLENYLDNIDSNSALDSINTSTEQVCAEVESNREPDDNQGLSPPDNQRKKRRTDPVDYTDQLDLENQFSQSSLSDNSQQEPTTSGRGSNVNTESQKSEDEKALLDQSNVTDSTGQIVKQYLM